MSEHTQDDIRRLLRSFGIKADAAISSYLAERKPARPLRLRVVVEEIGEGAGETASRLCEVEGEVRA